MLEVTFYPATYGDCIWITYGNPSKPRHILIDGGTGGTSVYIANRLKELEASEQQLELVVVSHIDRDHIEGLLRVFEKYGGVFNTKDFWFNGWKHLKSYQGFVTLGAQQGRRLVVI
ncbi:MBL fold metallo-hydrolase [Chitinophaga sedimenti]|uniref:MBL fold metallo-hydrolase n=1 Tax=Chitinophaga sedimenti TaxID=2033606 RepID=UPI00200436D7|nr:MBL fold metallo-hydrolase [Chitinophaga sedimenti]MCK7559379.1 MBL fold metallo-hydrolase [Chitinophaga sedimenti]